MGTRLYKKQQEVTFKEVTDLDKLKEVILHDCKITDFSTLAQAANLQSLNLVNCDFDVREFEALKSMETLKELCLRQLKTLNLQCLTEVPSLKRLRMLDLEWVDWQDVAALSQIQNLFLENMEVTDMNFMKTLKNLRVLELKKIPIENLDFLYDIPKLKEFTMNYRAAEESGLQAIENMKSLQQFHYPVGDMLIYRNCPKIKAIGVDAARIQNLDALAGKDGITEVLFYYLETKEQYEQLLEAVKKHLNLRSYGYTGVVL